MINCNFSEFKTSRLVPILSVFSDPKMDIRDLNDHYDITVELPGFDKKNVSIEVVDNVLKITAVKNQEMNKNDKEYLKRERCQEISKSVTLGNNINVDEIKASLDKGILAVTVPKTPEPKKDIKRIDIE